MPVQSRLGRPSGSFLKFLKEVGRTTAVVSGSFRLQHRHISVYPQSHYKAQNSKVVQFLKRDEPAKDLSEREKEQLTDKLHAKIWSYMSRGQKWDEWERTFSEFKTHRLPFNEVTYTLLLHGYVLSHRHPSENAYMVLEEMKQCKFIPTALLRMNEGMLNSYFELLEMDARPQASAWQNVARLCYHSAARYRKKRKVRLREELTQMSGDEVLKLTPRDIQERFLLDRNIHAAELNQREPTLLYGGSTDLESLEDMENFEKSLEGRDGQDAEELHFGGERHFGEEDGGNHFGHDNQGPRNLSFEEFRNRREQGEEGFSEEDFEDDVFGGAGDEGAPYGAPHGAPGMQGGSHGDLHGGSHMGGARVPVEMYGDGQHFGGRNAMEKRKNSLFSEEDDMDEARYLRDD